MLRELDFLCWIISGFSLRHSYFRKTKDKLTWQASIFRAVRNDKGRSSQGWSKTFLLPSCTWHFFLAFRRSWFLVYYSFLFVSLLFPNQATTMYRRDEKQKFKFFNIPAQNCRLCEFSETSYSERKRDYRSKIRANIPLKKKPLSWWSLTNCSLRVLPKVIFLARKWETVNSSNENGVAPMRREQILF